MKNNKNIDNENIVLYNVGDIQRIFNIGKTKAYQLVNSNGFPTIRINKKIYIPKLELEKWISRNVGKTFNY